MGRLIILLLLLAVTASSLFSSILLNHLTVQVLDRHKLEGSAMFLQIVGVLGVCPKTAVSH